MSGLEKLSKAKDKLLQVTKTERQQLEEEIKQKLLELGTQPQEFDSEVCESSILGHITSFTPW